MVGTELIILGLALDAIGAFFIVKPFLRLFIVNRDKITGEVISRQTKTAGSRTVQNHAYLGFGLLSAGFILQAIGVYFQTIEFKQLIP